MFCEKPELKKVESFETLRRGRREKRRTSGKEQNSLKGSVFIMLPHDIQKIFSEVSLFASAYESESESGLRKMWYGVSFYLRAVIICPTPYPAPRFGLLGLT